LFGKAKGNSYSEQTIGFGTTMQPIVCSDLNVGLIAANAERSNPIQHKFEPLVLVPQCSQLSVVI